VVKDLGFSALGGRNQVFVKHLQNIFADFGELGFNLLTVFLDQRNLTLIAL
jgi:hypothetical protein